MIKFLKKYKYTSLTIAALAIAVVSGFSGFMCHKSGICKMQIQRVLDAGFNNDVNMSHRDKGYFHTSETQIRFYNAQELTQAIHTTYDSTTLRQPDQMQDGSCCKSCSQGLPCESKTKSKSAGRKQDDAKTLDSKAEVARIISEKQKPKIKKPIIDNKDMTKATTSNGAVDLSVDKFSVLPSKEGVPSVDTMGSIEFHLDKGKETKSIKNK